ncbi:transcription factor bHLH25-like isoform X1 [Quercus robur]|uniref:transcription factor bHLH25-like isoform X1 n=1 Tax=Quercus robur TaxID=38942 RepID=UPI0021639A6E|nr:transcription factor bHLH25-like isoform X1 [Quercus robur]
MEISSAKWLSELGMDEYNYIHQSHTNTLDGFTTHDMATAMVENFQQSLSSESYSSYPTFTEKATTTLSNTSAETFQRPAKQPKTNSWDSCITDHVSPIPSSSHILSFENSISMLTNPQEFYGSHDSSLKLNNEMVSQANIHFPPLISKDSFENQDYAPKASLQGIKRTYSSMTRNPSNAQDHIIAERRRREKLGERFIALSAIVPGLKKMDKASVLGEAINYVKELQERIKLFEEQTKKRTVESVVFVKKSQLSADDDTSSCNENSDNYSDEALLEIEARISEKDVLIRIHCEKQKGAIVKILSEIEKLHLIVVNSSVLPFGNSTIDITIIAQKGNEFNMTTKDLVKTLRVALLKEM